MDTIKFLEQIASNVHYKVEIEQALLKQPESIRFAFNLNNGDLISSQLDIVENFPDTCTIIQGTELT